MIDNSGTYVLIANEAVAQQGFKDVPLHTGGKADVLINSRKLYRSLAENMKNRLLVCQSSHSSYTSNECFELDYTDFTECIKVLYPVYWHDNVDVRFGENEISKLCARFGVSTRPTLRSFRSFVKSHGKTVEDHLRRLVSSVAVIPVSTAECERGFSAMNLLLTPRRSSLHVTTL